MSKSAKKRAARRRESRIRSGLPPEGHVNRYDGWSGSPGAKQKDRMAIEAADGTIEDREIRRSGSSRRSAGGTMQYKALFLYDGDAGIGLIVGEDLPSSLEGSGRVFDMGGKRLLKATVIGGVTNPQYVRRSAEDRSVKIDYVQVVGREGFVPGDGTSEFYGEPKPGGTHAFRMIEDSPARNSRLVEDILAQISDRVPAKPQVRGYSGDAWRRDYGESRWSLW